MINKVDTFIVFVNVSVIVPASRLKSNDSKIGCCESATNEEAPSAALLLTAVTLLLAISATRAVVNEMYAELVLVNSGGRARMIFRSPAVMLTSSCKPLALGDDPPVSWNVFPAADEVLACKRSEVTTKDDVRTGSSKFSVSEPVSMLTAKDSTFGAVVSAVYVVTANAALARRPLCAAARSYTALACALRYDEAADLARLSFSFKAFRSLTSSVMEMMRPFGLVMLPPVRV